MKQIKIETENPSQTAKVNDAYPDEINEAIINRREWMFFEGLYLLSAPLPSLSHRFKEYLLYILNPNLISNFNNILNVMDNIEVQRISTDIQDFKDKYQFDLRCNMPIRGHVNFTAEICIELEGHSYVKGNVRNSRTNNQIYLNDYYRVIF